MTLYDFEEMEALHLDCRAPVRHPLGGESVVGWVGLWNGEGDMYLSPRTRVDHYFFKHEGYGVSCTLLEELDRRGVQTVFIAENDTGTMYEYDMDRFRRASAVQYAEFDPQKIVPTADARRAWDAEKVVIGR